MRIFGVLSVGLFVFAVAAKLTLGEGPSWMTVVAAFAVGLLLGATATEGAK